MDSNRNSVIKSDTKAEATNTNSNEVSPVIGCSVLAVVAFIFFFGIFSTCRWLIRSVPVNEASSVIYTAETDAKSKIAIKSFPQELYVLTKCLGSDISPAANTNSNSDSLEEIEAEIRLQILDLHKSQSTDSDIQYLVSETLQLLNESETLIKQGKSLPKSTGFLKAFGAGFLDGVLMEAGLPPSGASAEVIDNEFKRAAAVENLEDKRMELLQRSQTLQYLLLKIIPRFSAELKNDNCFNIDFYESPARRISSFSIYNKGATLQNCIFHVKFIGSNGKFITQPVFSDQCPSKKWITESCGDSLSDLDGVERIEVTYFSPQYSTVSNFDYDDKERGKDYAELFKNAGIQIVGYRSRKPGLFKDWERLLRIRLTGDDIPACQIAVIFTRNAWSYAHYEDCSYWSVGTAIDIKPGNENLTYDPEEITIKVKVPRSTFVIRKTAKIRDIDPF
jgi:hypothetical protein